MCGVVGLARFGGGPLGVGFDVIADRMADSLIHRGPDSSGSYASDDGVVCLAHRRLAVVDLSEHGHQPMRSKSGRWAVSYNGEMYNAVDLRHRLGASAPVWSGHSDTEVLVEALDAWGLERTVREVDGMFAFIAYDSRERVLWLCRDRFGEKPLFYARVGGVIAVASELKAFRSLPGFEPTMSRDAILEILEFGHSVGPSTIFAEVSRVLAGTAVRLDLELGQAATVRYWDFGNEADRARSTPSNGDVLGRLDETLLRSVKSRMVSDVPLGAFLSGGVDSSLVVAAMTKTSSLTPRTFTIGFPEVQYDESSFARAVARQLGADHTEFEVSHREALELVPKLSSIAAEPFADSSLLPSFIVSQMARQHVTVALSGDGGDELFGGYERYHVLSRYLAWQQRLPSGVRRRLGSALASRPLGAFDSIAGGPFSRVLPRDLRRRTSARITKFGRFVSAEPRDSYRALMAINSNPASLLRDPGTRSRNPYDLEAMNGQWSSAERAMLLDTVVYLPDDLLTKVDRASMAVSLEVRCPFLSPEMFRLAWSLTPEQRSGRSEGKVLLRELLRTYMPAKLVDRPKMGFGVPIGPWLRGPLASWADDILAPESLDATGVFSVENVRDLWSRHRLRSGDFSQELWSVLMTQSWLTEWENQR